MATKQSKKPVCKTGGEFVAAHLGKHALGVLTGQDARAFHAFAHLMELYCASDTAGRVATIAALKATLQAAQVKTWPLFKKLIPHALDWSDEERLWQEITA